MYQQNHSFPRQPQHTKIIFTVGPATQQPAILDELLETGVDIARLNMAHATHDWCREVIRNIRESCRRVGRDIAIMMDVKGPEIRTRDLPQTIHLKKADIVELFYQPSDPKSQPMLPEVARGRRVGVNYHGIADDLSAGDTVLVDSGLIRMKVIESGNNVVICQVEVPGPLSSRRHINLPGVHVKLPSLTEKDREDILIGIEESVEFFALSFVREANDLVLMREFLSRHGSKADIVAKIEDQMGVTNIEDIIRASDGVMVARGDLGIEVPFEELAVFQRQAVKRCLSNGKPVIVATHMLESMIENPMPTRAEITDISNAVREMADCVMLSGETTVGKYPVACVQVMRRIVSRIQEEIGAGHNSELKLRTPKEKMLRSAVVLAEELRDTGILVFTRSGDLARMMAALRPNGVPLFGFTDVPSVYKKMRILWGIEPFFMEFQDDSEATILEAMDRLKTNRWIEPGQHLVAITNVLGMGKQVIDCIQLRDVE